MLQFLIGTLLVLSSLFLIALVLIQQGKGGGLAGAFGGMGGQSAFGTKAGDVFTRITIITALVWIFFCMLAIKLISKEKPRRSADSNPIPATAPLNPGATTPAATTPGDAKTVEPKKDDKAAPAATTPEPMAPATTPMTPAATTPATPAESSTPAPAATTPAAPATPEPAAPATPEKK